MAVSGHGFPVEWEEVCGNSSHRNIGKEFLLHLPEACPAPARLVSPHSSAEHEKDTSQHQQHKVQWVLRQSTVTEGTLSHGTIPEALEEQDGCRAGDAWVLQGAADARVPFWEPL